MKTKTIFKMLAAAMLMPTMLLTTACSNNDDEIVNTENPTNTKGYALPVTINVTRQGDATTRAAFDGSKLSFSTGDQLLVNGSYTGGNFAGVLTWQSEGKFSGVILTQNEYSGTADDLLSSADNAYATLLPAGYESYGYLSIAEEGTCNADVDYHPNKAFALTKAAAVEQFSYESAYSYSSGFALSPKRAIVSFSISGLAANKEVAVLFKDILSATTPVNVTTDATGVATFASAMPHNASFNYYSLTVDGNAITLPASKVVEAGKIYNISRSAAPVLSAATTSDIGKVAGADGKIYSNVAAAKAAGTTACAIIAYVGSATGESQNHGLAIAMKNAAAGVSVKWSSSNKDETLTNFETVSQAVTTAQSGRSNSQTSGFDDVSNYPAFYAALHNTITTSDGISADAPASGTSGWFLPSLYQWNMIVQGLSGKTTNLSSSDNDDYKASNLNTKIEAVGGTGLQPSGYWSSTERDGSRAWFFGANYGSVNLYDKGYNHLYVRSAFAF